MGQGEINQAVLTVLIGTCNRRNHLHQCLDALRTYPKGFLKIIVSDAGSTDGSRDYLKAQNDLTIILESEKRGQARALNEAAGRAQTEFLCWISDDNIVRPEVLMEAVKCLRSDFRLGMLGLKVQDKTGPYAAIPFIGTVAENGVLNCNQGLIRKEVFDAVQGFDEGLRDYLIDRDLTTKVLLAGWDVALTKPVAIDHFRDHDTDSWISSESRKERIRNNQQIYLKRYAALSQFGVGLLVKTIRGKEKLRRHAMRVLIARWWKKESETTCQILHVYHLFSRAAFVKSAGVNPPGSFCCLRQSLPDHDVFFQQGGDVNLEKQPDSTTKAARIRKHLLRVYCAETDAITDLYIRDRSWTTAIVKYLSIRLFSAFCKDQDRLVPIIRRLTGLDDQVVRQLAGDIQNQKKSRQILQSALSKFAPDISKPLPA